MSATPETLIPVIRITNPLNPREFVRETLQWSAKKTLAEYFPVVSVVENPVVISINGRIVEEKDYPVTYLGPDDNLVVCPIPQGGGGGGKSVLRIVAMIAVVIASIYTGGAVGAAYGSMAGVAAQAGVMIAGTLLVNSLLPVNAAGSSALGRGDLMSSASYGVDGAKNVSAEGVPVPVCYGKFRMGGNLIGLSMVNDGQTQYAKILINAGEGPIAGITDIEINDTPVSDYKEVAVDVRGGWPTQDVIPWFANTIVPRSRGVRLTTDWSVPFTTEAVVDEVRMDYVFPNGLTGVDTKTGDSYAVAVDIETQYRQVGDPTWRNMRGSFTGSYYPVYHYYVYQYGQVIGETQSLNLASGYSVGSDSFIYSMGTRVGYVESRPAYGSTGHVVENVNYAKRVSFSSGALPRGRYEIRTRRTNARSTSSYVQDDVQLTDINEIIYAGIGYKHTALVGIQVRLTDQISSLPKVTYINHGVIHKYWNSQFQAWEWKAGANPAWIVWDMLTNTRYGAGMPEARMDFQQFKRWGKFCEDNGLEFNGVIDTSLNLWDALQYVMRAGRAQMVSVGTRYTVAIECPTDPVMMFSVGNILDGTFKESWLGLSDRANEVEVTFFDSNDGYKQRTIRVADPAAIAAGRPPKTAAITLPGIVTPQRAYQEALLQLNLNRYVLQTVEFGAPLDALACTVGDVILVQHDMPQWGFGGRLAAGSTASMINLDRDVSMQLGKQYKLLVLFDKLQRAAGSVVQVWGSSIVLAGYDGYNKVKRLTVGGRDLEVLSVFDAGGSWGVVVADATGVAAGQEYTLWDTDVIEERDVVVNTIDPTSTLTLQSPFWDAPATYANWMFGEVGKVRKPFRVKSISGSGEYRRDIVAIEYNPSVYDLSGNVYPTPNYSSIEAGVRHVSIDDVSEELFALGSTLRSRVTVYFSSGQETYRNSRVYVSTNGGAFALVDSMAADRCTVVADEGQVLRFKVVATDVVGAVAPDSTAPVYEYKVLGKLAPPTDVKNFKVTKRTNDLLLTWDANKDVDLAGYEVRLGENWEDAQVITTGHTGTMITHNQDHAGTYYYLIRAIDTGGRMSKHVTVFKLVLDAPVAVRQFDCVQNLNRVEFRWTANPETDIVGYELREGAAWETSQLVAQVTATNFTVPAGAPGDRMFWIKAIGAPGIYSDLATFSTTQVASLPNRNVVMETDESAAGFPGVKINTRVEGPNLLMSADANDAEYIFRVDPQDRFRALNSLYTRFDAVQYSDLTWLRSTFPWSSDDAQVSWLKRGDLTKVKMETQISTSVGQLQDDELDGWNFDFALNSARGNPPLETSGPTVYTHGRYHRGVYLGDFHATYPVMFGANWNTSFWLNMEDASTQTLASVWNDQTGEKLTVSWDGVEKTFSLVDSRDGSAMTIHYEVASGDRVFVCLVQTPAGRKFYVGMFGRQEIGEAHNTTVSTSLFTRLTIGA